MSKSHSEAANPLSDSDKEVFKQVLIGLRGTFANGATTNRPFYDMTRIESGIIKLGRRQFASADDHHRLDFQADVHRAPDDARTDVSSIILSIKRQKTGFDIFGAIGSVLAKVFKKGPTSGAKSKEQDDHLRLTPNGWQLVHTPNALSRKAALSEYKPEAANPIGEITTEFLTHLRRTLDAEK